MPQLICPTSAPQEYIKTRVLFEFTGVILCGYVGLWVKVFPEMKNNL